jgi:hypothetical protein
MSGGDPAAAAAEDYAGPAHVGAIADASAVNRHPHGCAALGRPMGRDRLRAALAGFRPEASAGWCGRQAVDDQADKFLQPLVRSGECLLGTPRGAVDEREELRRVDVGPYPVRLLLAA